MHTEYVQFYLNSQTHRIFAILLKLTGQSSRFSTCLQ